MEFYKNYCAEGPKTFRGVSCSVIYEGTGHHQHTLNISCASPRFIPVILFIPAPAQAAAGRSASARSGPHHRWRGRKKQ